MVMTQCPRCHEVLRRDEDLIKGQFPETERGPQGGFIACGGCIAELTGEPEPLPKFYPVGERVPIEPGTRDAALTICGVCRHALYWGDSTRHIRLQEEDLITGPGKIPIVRQDGGDIEPGGYAACADCVEVFKPSIHARLIREGRIGEDVPKDNLSDAQLS